MLSSSQPSISASKYVWAKQRKCSQVEMPPHFHHRKGLRKHIDEDDEFCIYHIYSCICQHACASIQKHYLPTDEQTQDWIYSIKHEGSALLFPVALGRL